MSRPVRRAARGAVGAAAARPLAWGRPGGGDPDARRGVPGGARRRTAWRRGVVVALALTGLLAVAGCGGRATTHHKPGTSHQEAAGNTGTLLAARDGNGHRLREVPAAGAPAVRAEVRPDSEGGWNLRVDVSRFRFTPESAGGAAVPGRGHARLLVDGKETARLYGPWAYVPPGARALTVRLHADDHTAWAVAGRPVETTVALNPGTTSSPSTPAPGRTVAITVSGSSVQPPPSRIELKKGERLTLRVTSDRADTLHVHGYDRELPLRAGESAVLALTADRTGLFEVETHDSGLLLTQLVVR
ncbi:hypothetical protein ABZO31_06110 [Streptomyces sp. HUAS MG47]|uniref:hypothetical protein n=1 Tax=Streptomyces solicamelliae TaxID=3231716 RepID=UPI003877CF69